MCQVLRSVVGHHVTIIRVNTLSSDLVLVGVPLDLGAESLGVEVGPDALRQKKIIEKLEHAGFKVNDLGNIPCPNRNELTVTDPKAPYLNEIARVNEEVASLVDKNLQASHRAIVLGGDHSINLGAFAGAENVFGDKLGLIYIDAHADSNTPENSISHNIHGMHLASLMGFGPDELTHLYQPRTKLPTANLLHIAGSDFDHGEAELFKREKITSFSMLDLLSDGLRPLLELISEFSRRLESIWVSVDLDAIDTLYAPGVGIPNQGGLTYREVAAITEYIGKNCNVVGIDLVEYNPMSDIEGKTAELGIEIIAKLLGSNYSWYTNYMDRNTGTGGYIKENQT